MGTDIHPVVQFRDANKEWHDIKVHPDTLDDRCYALFAVLANVRNGFGFAGVPTGQPVKPIAEPRGLPDDFDLEKHESDDKYMGDHSFTWVTLRELNEYPWHETRMRTGVLTLEEWEKWDKLSEPENYCGGVMGRDIETVSHDAALYKLYPRNKKIYVQVTWGQTIATSVRGFFTDVLPWLRTLGEPDEVRIVMGFDS